MHHAPEQEGESSLMGHLIELRARLVRGVVGVGVILLALLPFTRSIYTWLAGPLISQLPAGQTLIAINPAGAFFAPVKLTFFVALFFAAPWLLYQAWAFVAPGLYSARSAWPCPCWARPWRFFMPAAPSLTSWCCPPCSASWCTSSRT